VVSLEVPLLVLQIIMASDAKSHSVLPVLEGMESLTVIELVLVFLAPFVDVAELRRDRRLGCVNPASSALLCNVV
jgi:hypothetical protein